MPNAVEERWTWSRIRELAPSPRVQRLSARMQERYAQLGHRLWTEPEHARLLTAALLRAYRATPEQPAILRRARALTEFAQAPPLPLHPDDLLLGAQTFGPLWGPGCSAEDREELHALGWGINPGHIVHDYERMLTRGVSGLREDLERRAASPLSPDQQVSLQAFREALEAFRTFVILHARAAEEFAADLEGAAREDWLRHARDLTCLADHPPQTFPQALQLLWLTQVFLHAENPSVAISFGRIDQYLWPFLQADLGRGHLRLPEAFDLLCAFLLKCCEGEESQNAVLGGVDETGEDATNPLSLLFLAAMSRMRTFQPSLSVRLHPGSPEDFVQAACELATEGTGNPGFMNDPVVIAALQAAGIPTPRARDWAVVGCYEAVPQGDCYGNTVFLSLHLAEILNQYLATPTAQAASTFEVFLEGWWQHFGEFWNARLTEARPRWQDIAARAPSPFGSLILRGCLERLRPLEAGGGNHNLVGVNLLGLGTLVDCMHAVRELVFRQRALTLAQLSAAVAADFPDEALRHRLLHLPGRYGTDTAATNDLARHLSEQIARLILGSRLSPEVRPYPGFFAFSGDIYRTELASPDGRRRGDLLSYGVAPASAVETSATAALLSASHVAHALCACGNPFSLTLTARDLAGPPGARLVRELVEGYFGLGGFHLHFNRLSVEELRRAQERPEEYAHLMVRVSGYSARFVNVDRRWQEALIERAQRGQ